jgi:hypothetical protein
VLKEKIMEIFLVTVLKEIKWQETNRGREETNSYMIFI